MGSGVSGLTPKSNAKGTRSENIRLLPALEDGKTVTKARKDDAMYALTEATSNLNYRPAPENDRFSGFSDREWYLAEVKKYGTTRIIKDKDSNDWITTTYGTMNGKSGYFGLNVRTGEMISSELAEKLYHKSRA